MLRFIAVGVINTAFGYGAYCLFIAFGLPFPVAGFLALCAGIAWSFFTSGRLGLSPNTSRAFRTLRACLGAHLRRQCRFHLARHAPRFERLSCGAAASLPTLPSAFFLQRFLVFGNLYSQAVRMTPPAYAARLEALFDLRMRQPLLFHLAAILAIGLMLAVYIRFFLNDYFSCTGCSPYFWSVIDEFVSLTTNGKWSSSGTMLSDAFSGAFPVYYNYMSDTLMTFLAGRLGVPPFHFSAIHYGPALGVLMTLVNYVSVYAVTRSIFVAALATIIITFMGDGILTDWMPSLYGYEGQEITYVKATIHVPVTALPSGTNAVLGLVLILPVLSVIFLAERNGSVVLFTAGGALLGLLFQAHTLTFMFVMSALCVFADGERAGAGSAKPNRPLLDAQCAPHHVSLTGAGSVHGVLPSCTSPSSGWPGSDYRCPHVAPISLTVWRSGSRPSPSAFPIFTSWRCLANRSRSISSATGTFRVVILAVLMLPHWIALALLLLNVRRYATRVPDLAAARLVRRHHPADFCSLQRRALRLHQSSVSVCDLPVLASGDHHCAFHPLCAARQAEDCGGCDRHLDCALGHKAVSCPIAGPGAEWDRGVGWTLVLLPRAGQRRRAADAGLKRGSEYRAKARRAPALAPRSRLSPAICRQRHRARPFRSAGLRAGLPLRGLAGSLSESRPHFLLHVSRPTLPTNIILRRRPAISTRSAFPSNTEEHSLSAIAAS